MKATRHGQCRGRSSGFTLIEVLVAIVILGIGLLGIAKLMLYSSRSNDSAYLRSQATELAYEMLDEMRANSTQAAGGVYNTTASAAAANPGFTCTDAVCPNLALYDVYQWKLRLNATSGVSPPGALPSGQGSVTTTPVGSQTTVVITVSWNDTVAGASFGETAATQSITLESVL
jgi:type IV pilus assembly protein PilV